MNSSTIKSPTSPKPSDQFLYVPEKFWYIDGIEYSTYIINGNEKWFKWYDTSSVYHREDGPAITYWNGSKESGGTMAIDIA